MKIIITLTAAVLIGAAAVAATKVIATDHTHTETELAAPPLEKWTPGHSGGLDQNGGHWDRKNGTYHYHR